MKKSNKIEFVSVVVPVYNEEGCLQELIDRTLAALDGSNSSWSTTGAATTPPKS